jgi:phytoene desaturase
LFSLAGEPMEEYLQYEKVDTSCTYFYENGKVIHAFAGSERYATELEDKAGENKVSVIQYMSRSEKLYKQLGSVFLNSSLHLRQTWFSKAVLKAISGIRYPYLFSTLADYNKSKFRSPEARQIFNRYATYNGSNPFKAPAMLSIIPHLEQNEGTFYPKGGMVQITDALHKLAEKKGVRFHFNTPVDRIIHTQAKVQGVVVNKQNKEADIVVSNADVFFTYRDLLKDQPRAEKLMRKERSSSALLFYWGMRQQTPALGLHNIFFSEDYEKEFKSIFKFGLVPSDPTVYVNITSRMDSSHAPPGKENWFVMINVPPNKGQNWEEIKIKARENILKKLSRILQTDVGALIETEETMDPVSIEEKTGSFMGALYGTSSNTKMAAFSRHPNFTSYAEGLYFCGGSVHPGGGIPLCLKSAKIVADLVSRNHKIAAAN